MLRRNAGGGDDADFAATAFGLEWDSAAPDENWMVTYADIISTLLAMVVLLFGRMAITNATPAEPVDETTIAAVDERIERPVALAPLVGVAIVEPRPTAEPTQEDRLAALVETRFEGRIKAEQRAEGLVLTIPDVALFDSARAALQDAASPLLADLAATLHEAGDAGISVEGHTDDVPVQGGEFDSNWDLAAARANAVTRYLLDRGFEPKRLHSVSYADTRPVADNGTSEGRAANRRVELKIEFVGG
jgi:chemotaxis protein MotB